MSFAEEYSTGSKIPNLSFFQVSNLDSDHAKCVRIAFGSSSCIIVLVYCTGLVTPTFFTELSNVLDRVVTYIDPVFLVGDVNIRLDRADDPASRLFTE